MLKNWKYSSAGEICFKFYKIGLGHAFGKLIILIEKFNVVSSRIQEFHFEDVQETCSTSIWQEAWNSLNAE